MILSNLLCDNQLTTAFIVCLQLLIAAAVWHQLKGWEYSKYYCIAKRPHTVAAAQ